MVTNSILETMQGIEAEAKQILADYDAKVQGLRSQFTQELECIETDCDKKTQIEVEGLSKELAEKTTQLKENLTRTIAKNDSNVRSVLMTRKDGLVQQIVDRVVEKYGN